MTTLTDFLETFRDTAKSEREKGNYFEKLVKVYLLNEPYYADLYGGKVWLWEEWRREWLKRGNGDPGADAGIDLVAESATGEFHAIQAKFYAEDAKLKLDDFGSFFTASSKKHFSHRLIFLTATSSTHHLREAVKDQHPPVNLISLFELENSKIDWASFQPQIETVKLRETKTLRPHQMTAVDRAVAGLVAADRGKLIMACGTGKTFTTLRLAEQLAGAGGRVLFLVPSLNLLSQTLTEWTQEALVSVHGYAVCSDSDVGKKRQADADDFKMLAHELQYPATTQPDKLAKEIAKRHDADHMSVVFSTYHSIDVISQAQLEHGLADFDLIICDEAHRTTGATFGDDDESAFVRVHDANYIRSAKRIYMTATPRIYGDNAKAKAETDNVALCSMDDEALYGKELYVITFSEAVRRGLLCDYKVIVLSIEETHVNRRIQQLLKDESNQLKVDDAAKIIGCWKALSKQGLSEDLVGDTHAMKRAVAFCQVIEIAKAAKTHKVSSKQIASMFQAVVEEYQRTNADEEFVPEVSVTLNCEAAHVDGGMNAGQKDEKLAWLKAEAPENTCRILSNVRCLSEGVDVPALDAVLFLTPRNSQVDVVQSVGRVMRNAPGKKRGYVILPVVIPAGMEPHEALNDNKTYSVVWQVLQALRSHDDRFDAMVNKLDLIGKDTSKMEVIAITDKIQKKQAKPKAGKGTGDGKGKGGFTIGEAVKKPSKEDQGRLEFEIGEIEKAIYAKLVQKVGNRHHWEDWANDISKIARTHIDRITGILEDPMHTAEIAAFNAFAEELRDDLNDSISDGEIIEMLAQHLITKPVFDALFEDYSFAQNNPMSLAMQGVLDVLQEHHLNKEADTLQSFYASVQERAKGIDNATGKQKIVVELYDKFFRNAFPKMTERLGIVYTPVELVDFIIHSVGYILKTEFGQTLGSKGVHIIDPFTGTGTFITRLLQSGLISSDELKHKYQNEIHANEIVLLAYYIAAINIEAVYHGIVGGDYTPFEGICLTDTFQMYEKEDLVDQVLAKNSGRRKKQKALDIRVIIGNPPYSAGQENQNDNNKNIDYPSLDNRITETYIEKSLNKMGKSKAYDSYIRAIRWASDRLGDSGVIGYVSGSGFAEKPAMDGLRKCLSDEFSCIHVINLRGDIRKNILSKGRAKEGQNVFGSSSMTGIAITLLVKNKESKNVGGIYYYDIGDDLSTRDKLEKIVALKSIAGISEKNMWNAITPDEHGDWINLRDADFLQNIIVGSKSDKLALQLFSSYSMGLKTNRDAWVYNFSKHTLNESLIEMIRFYNDESDRLAGFNTEDKIANLNRDKAKIKWTTDIESDLIKSRKHKCNPRDLIISSYRPFSKQWVYANANWNWTRHLMPKYFPDASSANLLICVSGTGARSGFSVLIVNTIPDLQIVDNGQCLPLYLYEAQSNTTPESDGNQGDMLTAIDEQGVDGNTTGYSKKDAITDEGLAQFQAAYLGEAINKEDLFYYVYGLLHSPDYRGRYADNLSKELPRIPRVKTAADFWAFSQAGRKLADLHLNYETVEKFPLKIGGGDLLLTDADYRIEKMRYGKNGKDKDLTTLHYNKKITVTGIPLEAYEYVVNGKPALDWVVERQCVKTDKDSGIVNDANDWAIDTMNNPKYPLELFQRVITVSLETMKIVNSFPALGDLS
jgi:predicted helicase